LVGTWELVSSEDLPSDGSRQTYPEAGPHGKGFLMYPGDGHMCVQLMNPDRPQWADAGHSTDAEKISAFDLFSAYCGRYEVDEAGSIIYHLPQTASARDSDGPLRCMAIY
jgi:Lipocalin-like domain